MNASLCMKDEAEIFEEKQCCCENVQVFILLCARSFQMTAVVYTVVAVVAVFSKTTMKFFTALDCRGLLKGLTANRPTHDTRFAAHHSEPCYDR